MLLWLLQNASKVLLITNLTAQALCIHDPFLYHAIIFAPCPHCKFITKAPEPCHLRAVSNVLTCCFLRRGIPEQASIKRPARLKHYTSNLHMGSCQNYGPFWGTLNNRCRIITGTQKGTIILTTTHMPRGLVLQGLRVRSCSVFEKSRVFQRFWAPGLWR